MEVGREEKGSLQTGWALSDHTEPCGRNQSIPEHSRPERRAACGAAGAPNTAMPRSKAQPRPSTAQPSRAQSPSKHGAELRSHSRQLTDSLKMRSFLRGTSAKTIRFLLVLSVGIAPVTPNTFVSQPHLCWAVANAVDRS